MVIAEHSPLADQSVAIEPAGLLKRVYHVQTVRQIMRCMQRIGMVLTKHTPTPGESVLTELTDSTIGTNIGEETNENISTSQGVLVVGSTMFAPPPVQVLGELACQTALTTTVEVPGGAANHISQGGIGTGGWIGDQEVGQELRPAGPAGRVSFITRICRD
jgi:hypothetical protein